jgi:hypothetical protein
MSEPGGETTRERFLAGPVAKAVGAKNEVLLDSAVPIEREPSIPERGRVPRDEWIERGPRNAGPPSKRYYFRDGGKDQTWETVAAEIGHSPAWLIWYNFRLPEPQDPAVVNWFLRNHVGARTPTHDRKNWTFENTALGYIYVPQTVEERLPRVRAAQDMIAEAMARLRTSFPDLGGKFGEARWSDSPYLSALQGFAETTNALVYREDFVARRGDTIAEAPEFPVPPWPVDTSRYRPQGYNVGLRAALAAWDALPGDLQVELGELERGELVDRLYVYLRDQIRELTGTNVDVMRDYPPEAEEQ